MRLIELKTRSGATPRVNPEHVTSVFSEGDFAVWVHLVDGQSWLMPEDATVESVVALLTGTEK
jgi:hypothetical protein